MNEAVEIKHHTTFYGTNPYTQGRAIVFELKLPDSGAVRKHVEENLVMIYKILPSDFNPQRSSDLKKGIPYFIFDMLNYTGGNLRYLAFSEKYNKFLFALDFHSEELVKSICAVLQKIINVRSLKSRVACEVFDNIFKLTKNSEPDFQAHVLIRYAQRMGISYVNLKNRIWVYGMGAKSQCFFETSTLEDMKKLRLTKRTCKDIFLQLSCPTASYLVLNSSTTISDIEHNIGYPLVVKPVVGGGGRGITAGIENDTQLYFAIDYAKKFAGDHEIIIEKHIFGDDHRLMFVGGEFIGCVKSQAPYVVGDGVNNISNLIAVKNEGRSISFYKSNFKRPIKVNDGLINKLNLQGLTLSSILPKNKKVTLQSNANLGGGGDSFLVEHVHPEIIRLAKLITDETALYSVGIDYITTDITSDPQSTGGGFTEINKTPGLPVYIGAGYTVDWLGEKFLSKICSNIDCNVFVYKHGLSVKEIASLKVNAYIFPSYLLWKGVAQKIDGNSWVECWAKYLTNKKLTEINFFISDVELLRAGFPEQVTRVYLLSDVLDSVYRFCEESGLQYSLFSGPVDSVDRRF